MAIGGLKAGVKVKEWARMGDAMRILRRRRLRVSRRTVTRWAAAKVIATKHLPGASSWYLVNVPSLLEVARCYCDV